MTEHYVAIAHLNSTRQDILNTIKGIEAKIAPLVEQRAHQAARLRSVEASLAVLQEEQAQQEPGTDYSPADGEQDPRHDQQDPRLQLLPGERLQFVIPGGLPIVQGEVYTVRQMARPELHGRHVRAVDYSPHNNKWRVRMVGGTYEAFVPSTDLVPAGADAPAEPPFPTGMRVVIRSDFHAPEIAGETVVIRQAGITMSEVKTLGVSGSVWSVPNEYLTEER